VRGRMREGKRRISIGGSTRNMGIAFVCRFIYLATCSHLGARLSSLVALQVRAFALPRLDRTA
jgi:hypothetical protein